MQLKSKAYAQKRADQIGCFQAELDILEREDILMLTEIQHSAVSNYHEKLIAELVSVFDIDANQQEKQLSLGMKISSFLGALGLAASIFFLFYQFWGNLSTPAQVCILVSASVISVAATLYISGREKTGYFSKLLGLVSFTCFVLNLSMLGQIFNIAPSENVFLAWAAFAFVLAYASDARLLLAAGIICFANFLSAKTGTWNGSYWIYFGERPENFFPSAFILFLIPLIPHHRFSGFSAVYHVFAMLFFFIPVLILSNWGGISYLNFSNNSIEIFYQLVGFIVSGLAIYLGIKQNWTEVINTGNVFFTIFLYTKLYDWWWNSMPKYLFFLMVGLTSILMLLILKRQRLLAVRHVQQVTV